MSDDPFEKWREADKEYFGNSTLRGPQEEIARMDGEHVESRPHAGGNPRHLGTRLHPSGRGGRALRVTSRLFALRVS